MHLSRRVSTGHRYANLRNFCRKQVLPLLKCPKPSTDILTQRTCGNPPKGSLTKFDPSQRSSQQRNGSIGIPGIEVVEGRCRLNQRLQKTLFRFLQCQPDALPMLVGKKEFRVTVAIQALGKRP